MPNKIKLMPELLSSKIAAGEVVERPASVVKELVENAIDAGAIEITVNVTDGGRQGIRVTDNGSGIPRADAPLAFGRFATSKITTEADLDNITTMGFRGEALSSIASVAKVTLTTRTGEEVAGTKVTVNGGSAPVVTEAGCPVGTVITVDELFYNTPARLKFMRTAQTEFGRIAETLKRIALSCPDIRFRLVHGNSNSLDVKKGELKERIADVFGAQTASALVPVGGAGVPEQGVSVSGFVGRPELNFATGKNVNTYINKRWVRDRSVSRAVADGFSGMIEAGRYPFCVLNITLPSDHVDVNVHPAKSEVRFGKPSFVFSLVKAAVKDALRKSGVSRGGVESVPVSGGPVDNRSSYSRPDDYRGGGARSFTGSRINETQPRGGYADNASQAGSQSTPPAFRPEPREEFLGARGLGLGQVQGSNLSAADALPFRQTDKDVLSPEFLEMQVVGQLWGEFLIVEGRGEFFLIDQHGAAERIRYERLRAEYREGKGVSSQYLLIPERFETTPEEREELNKVIPCLEKVGFDIASFGPSSTCGGDTYMIKAVPEVLTGRDSARLIKDLVEELADVGGSARVEQRLDAVFMRIACHSVIRGPRPLTTEEARALLAAMARVDFAANCPHGRPVIKTYSRAEVEAMFGRT